VYRAKIMEAEMRAPKTDPSKPDYLNLKLTLFDKDNKNCGSIYDIISESDSSVVQYKVGRFVRACGIPLTGKMELRDLSKIVKGKTFVVDVNHDKPQAGKQPRAQVDVFSGGAYYLDAEFDEIYALRHPDEDAPLGDMNAPTGADEETPFDALDGNAPVGQRPEY
jgi:hypothetical protein